MFILQLLWIILSVVPLKFFWNRLCCIKYGKNKAFSNNLYDEVELSVLENEIKHTLEDL